MRENVLPFPAKSINKLDEAGISLRQQSLWTAICVTATVGTFFLFAGGIIVSLMAYLETGFYTTMNSRIGGILFFAAFPVCFLAAHALDKIAFYRQAGKKLN